MDATKIMVIRHAEKPDTYNGVKYRGVDANGTENEKSLVTLGWERAGALGTLFAPPWGPKAPNLSTPSKLYASDPKSESNTDVSASDDEPSQRPYQTILSVAALLGLSIDTHHAKKDYKDMVKKAL